MAKAKKRATARKKSAKRGKASVKPARKKTAKRAMAKKPKSKVHPVTKRVPTAEEKPASAESQSFRYSGASLEELNDLIEAANSRARETWAAPSALSEEENVSGPHVDISSDLVDIGSDPGELPEQKVA